jgi:PAS domain S-box-containing protein
VSNSKVDILQRALERERIARKEAERILEDKSRQLYELSEELKKTNKALQGNLSEKTLELQAIFDNSSLGIVLTKYGKIIETNKAFEELLGFTSEELKKMDVQSISVSDDYPSSRDLMEKLNNGIIDKFSVNKRYVKKNSTVIWAKTNVAAIRDKSGQIIYQVALVEDITEDLKLQEDRKELIGNLEKQNKDLREFAHIVSHDLKSPLRSMDTLVNWLKEYYESNDVSSFNKTYDMLIEKVGKMDSLIDGVLRYSSIDSAKQLKEKINLKLLLENTLHMLHIPEHIEIRLSENLPIIEADVYRIQQLFQNLLSNAIKSIDKPKGVIVIGCEDKKHLWEFSISDNGKGIPIYYKDKIFEIFQSLDNNDESTGIGLSIVKKIIEFYNGDIWFTSEEGKGTEFNFTIKK